MKTKSFDPEFADITFTCVCGHWVEDWYLALSSEYVCDDCGRKYIVTIVQIDEEDI